MNKNTIYRSFKTILIFISLCINWSETIAQENNSINNDAVWVQKDLPQIIRGALGKPPVTKSDEKGSLLLIPIVASNPATGFMVGVGGQYVRK
jgi:hypothetical protein